MIFLFYGFFLLSLLLFAKAILFWIYLWQLKEYRFDRFWAEYAEPKKLLRFWLGCGGRKIWQPVWTPKAILIFFLSLLTVAAASVLSTFNIYLVLFYMGIYLLIPILVSLIVVLFKIPTYFAKKTIFSRAARKMKAIPNLTVIGITGSFGKSSTKEFLAQILSRKFRVAKTPLNQNSEIGIANFIINGLPQDAQIFVVEMGAYRRGEIKKICEIVKPKIGILTGIDEQHLALFGSLENVKYAKFELIRSLPQDGLAVFNGENQNVLDLAKNWSGKGIIYRNSVYPMYKNLPRHYELNLNGAIEVAKYLGMTTPEIDEAIKSLYLDSNMIKTFTGKNGAFIIDDTYSANPDGVLAALDYLKEQPQKTKIVVMPCLIELGDAAPEIHRKIGRKIEEATDFAIIITPDYFKDIKKEAGDKAFLMANPDKIRDLLGEKMNSNSAILLEGRLPKNIINIVK